MILATKPDDARAITAKLRAHRADLRAAGIRHLSLFGSAARGSGHVYSDIDLVAELDAAASLGLFALMGLRRGLVELLDRPVNLLPEPIESPRLKALVEHDRRRAF